MVGVSWLVCSTLFAVISFVDEVNSDVLCPSVVDNAGGKDEGVCVDNAASSVEPLSSVDDSNVVLLMDSVSVVEGNWVVCVCWLVLCSTVDEDISVVDAINSDVLCPSVIVDNEDGEVLFVDIIVSTVDPLSLVDDSNVVVVIADISVVNVD